MLKVGNVASHVMDGLFYSGRHLHLAHLSNSGALEQPVLPSPSVFRHWIGSVGSKECPLLEQAQCSAVMHDRDFAGPIVVEHLAANCLIDRGSTIHCVLLGETWSKSRACRDAF